MKPRATPPIASWLWTYDRAAFRHDLFAGLTTAAMLIPQAMGYAMLAGLPPAAGLYAAFVPLLAYGILGGSRELAVGPVAIDSLLTAVAVSAIAQAGSDAYLAHAMALALMVGGIQIALGALGLGFVANFMSRPVISGFTSAAALVIGASQLQHLLGVPLTNSLYVHDVLAEACAQRSRWHGLTLALGLGNVALLVALGRLAPRIPRALLAVASSTALVGLLALEQHGVAIVGRVPQGLPGLGLPAFDLGALASLAPGALTIALIGFVEAIAVGKHFARAQGYEVRPGQELVALGAANAASGLFGGYPIAGGFSRTAVNAQAGARTPLAGMITAAVVGLTLVALTPLFHFMPHAVLAAIILTAVLGLFDLREPRRLWRVKRSDLWLLLFTFGMTLALGIQYGIMAGVGLSLVLFLVRSTRPHFAVLGQVPGTEVYMNVRRNPEAITHPGVLVVRIDAQIYFGNVSFLKATLRKLENEANDPVHSLVLDASGINQLDSSAEAALQEIEADYAARGIRLLYAHLKGPVRDVLARSGLWQRLMAEERVFLGTHDAVRHATQPRDE